ncbi:unknown [Firmicutes bacterium CAG:56]|nr:unknown [Firmicutes bacterium CAG:56]
MRIIHVRCTASSAASYIINHCTPKHGNFFALCQWQCTIIFHQNHTFTCHLSGQINMLLRRFRLYIQNTGCRYRSSNHCCRKNGCHNLSESHLHMISLPSARISLLLDSIRFMLSIGNSFLCPPSYFCTRQCLSVRFSFSMFIHFTMFDLFFLCNFIRFTTTFLFFVLNSYIFCTKLFSVFHVSKRMRTQKKRGVSPPLTFTD